jgi:hypothetical protein
VGSHLVEGLDDSAGVNRTVDGEDTDSFEDIEAMVALAVIYLDAVAARHY